MGVYLYYLMVFMLPFFATSPWKPFFGIPSGLVYVLVVVLAFCHYLFSIGLREGLSRIRKTPLLIFLLVFWVFNVVSVVLAYPRLGLQQENLVRTGYLAFSIIVYFLTYNMVDSKSVLLQSIKVFVLSCIVASLYGIWQTGGFMLGFDTGQIETWTVPRLFGTATEPQVFGNLLIPAITLAAGLFMAKVWCGGNAGGSLCGCKGYRLGFGLYVMLMAMVMTFSAGGWVGIAGAMVLVLGALCQLEKKRVVAFILILAMTGTTLVAFSLWVYPDYQKGFPMLMVKFQNKSSKVATYDESLSIRSRDDRAWFRAAAWKMYRDYPVAGIGTGNFRYLYNQYRPADAPEVPYEARVHNQYLEILSETGAIGFCLFLVILGQLCALVWKGLSSSGEGLLFGGVSLKLLLWLLFASLAGLAVQGLALGILAHNYLWVILGLTCAAANILTKESTG